VVELKGEIHSLKIKINSLERSVSMAEGEVSSLQSQVDAKSMSLEEAIYELEALRRERCSEESEGDKRQRKIEQLNIEVRISELIQGILKFSVRFVFLLRLVLK